MCISHVHGMCIACIHRYEERKHAAKLAAKASGRIREISEWGGELAESFERE